MEKHVFLVRHGESNSNVDRILRGAESELTEAGWRQAEIVADRIAKIGVETIISSPFQRARNTAAKIALKTGTPVEESDLFVEYERPSITLGKLEHDPEIQELRDLVYQGHLIPNFKHSDEENFEEVKERCEKALALLEQHESARLCVVSHGFFLRALLGAVLLGPGFTGKEFQRMYNHVAGHNTGITYIHFRDDKGWRLISWNDSAHLG